MEKDMSKSDQRIRLGMVGGGQGGFIGGIHRLAMRLDDQYELVAGALSSDPQKALASGRELRLAEDRIYSDFNVMAEQESLRPDGIEAVAIVTPNHLHFVAAKKFLSQGIHVICDKPMVTTLKEANELADVVGESGCIFALTHNYSGYPLIQQARDMIAEGILGDIRLVHVEYLQDWLTEPIEHEGHKQASWRTDPNRSGAGGAISDIGTHAYQLLTFVTGLVPSMIAADLGSLVPGRVLDDNANILLRFGNGARGTILISQVAPGNENALSLRIYGSKSGLEWQQENPNKLWYTPLGKRKQLITRAGHETSDRTKPFLRTPAGHPEGFIEAFANIYVQVAAAIFLRRKSGTVLSSPVFPGVEDGISGLTFIQAAIESSKHESRWTNL
jgi:predicted dehydrogenase